MAQPVSSPKFTYEDYLLFPDDGKRHELIDGEHYVTPSPRTKHQKISRNLHAAMWNEIQRSRRGHIFAAPMDVVLSDSDVVEPDLLFIRSDRSSIIYYRDKYPGPSRSCDRNSLRANTQDR